MRGLRLIILGATLLMTTGCASLPWIKPATPADTVAVDAEASAAVDTPSDTAATTDTDREAALRALPEGTVVIDKKEPAWWSKWWDTIWIFNKKKPEAPVASAPLWIGTIKVVNAAEQYVLIDSNLTVSIPPGEILNSVGNDFESGTVRTTADRMHPFFIADIASGNPAVGDRVYSPK